MPHLGQYHDDMIYWVTAKSLAQGSGYRILSLPDQPYQTKYPPLYPLLLSTAWRVFPAFPTNLPVAMLLTWVMLPLYAVASRWVMRDLGLSGRAAWLVAAALVLSPVTVLLSVTLMSDLLFSVLLFAALHWITRAGDPEAPGWTAPLAGLLSAAAYLTRLAALPLLLTGPLWLVLRGRRRSAAWFLAAMAPAVVAWTLWVRVSHAPATDIVTLYYTNYFQYQVYNLAGPHWLSLLSQNLALLLTSLTRLLTSQTAASVFGEFGWRLFVFAAVAGVVRLGRGAGWTPYHWYAAGLFPLLVVCAWPPDARSVVPLFPLLAAGLWREGKHLLTLLRVSTRRPALVGGALLACCFVPLVYAHGQALCGEFPGIFRQHRQLLAAQRQAYQWIDQNLPASASFVAYDDPVLYLYTGRHAASIRVAPRLYYEGDLDTFVRRHGEVEAFARERGLGYVFTTAGDYFRGEVPDAERARLLQSVEQSCAPRRVYASPLVAVCDFTSNASSTTSASTAAGINAATADF
jgi:4-amino-4-deoxy-L-arabinose transferase-like glycosyltransferase